MAASTAASVGLSAPSIAEYALCTCCSSSQDSHEWVWKSGFQTNIFVPST